MWGRVNVIAFGEVCSESLRIAGRVPMYVPRFKWLIGRLRKLREDRVKLGLSFFMQGSTRVLRTP